jgi:hypothetical protein
MLLAGFDPEITASAKTIRDTAWSFTSHSVNNYRDTEERLEILNQKIISKI